MTETMESVELRKIAEDMEQSDGIALLKPAGPIQIGIRRTVMVIAALRSATPPAAQSAPGHEDLMVAPESIDGWLKDNPLPDEPNTWNGGAPDGYYPQKYVDELRGKIEAMRKALEDCAGCVDAAEAEGLVESIEDLRGFSEHADRLIDLVERRLMWPRNYARTALAALEGQKP